MADDDEKTKLVPISTELKKMLATQEAAESGKIAPTININILLARAAETASNPKQLVEASEQLLTLAKKFDDQEIDVYRRRADAVIEAKIKDPDEIEKRQNNAVRRQMKMSLVYLAIVCLVGGIACSIAGCTVVVTGVLLSTGMLCVGVIAPLSSGESVSAREVATVVKAVGSAIRGPEQKPSNGDARKRVKR